MKHNILKKIYLLSLLLILNAYNLSIAYSCTYQCSIDPLLQIYPNQNMCLLLGEIPSELQNLPYGMYPNCDIYNTNRFNYNKRFNFFPHAIFTPETDDQVAYVFGILRKYNLKFSLRSGGHCYGPGSLSNGYVIDLRNFNNIDLNIARQEVVIGAGCKLGNIIEALGAADFALPTGTCVSVGITGLALGGGIGLLARQFGLTCDSIKDITLVTADGAIITADINNYADLFWALRGAGGGSYGIVLRMTFKMHYVPQATLVQLTFPWNPSQIPLIFNAWQSWIATLPTSITSEVLFKYNSGPSSLHQPTLTIDALKVGYEPFTEWEKVFLKFKPTVRLISGRYLDIATATASFYTQPFSKAKSKMLFEPLQNNAIQIIINFFETLRKSRVNYFVFFEIGSAFGGAISQGDTAYFPRNAFAWFFQFIYWQYGFEEAGALTTIKTIYDDLAPFTSPYSYANLIDYELGPDYLNAYYGDHVNRLVQVKNKYDPLNIFKWRQSIPLNYVLQSQLDYSIQRKYNRQIF